MSKLWKYNGYDDLLNCVPLGTEYKEPFVYQFDSPGNDYAEVTDEAVIDQYIENNHEELKDYKIFDLVNHAVKKKNLIDIQYNSELKNGIKLHSVHTFSSDGFLIKTDFYHNYIDAQNPGDLILTVEETYTTNPDDVAFYPSQRRIQKREKVRKWTDSNGNLDSNNIKKTEKIYDTLSKTNKEGKRRRDNVINSMSVNVGIGGVLSGHFADENDANAKMIDLMEFYSGTFSSYIKTGKGNLYADVTNDAEPSHSWLNLIVADTPQTQAMCPQMIGLTFREYIVDKLKGIVS